MKTLIGMVGFGILVFVLHSWLVKGEPVTTGTVAMLTFAGLGLLIAVPSLIRFLIFVGSLFGLSFGFFGLVTGVNVWLSLSLLFLAIFAVFVNGIPSIHGEPHG